MSKKKHYRKIVVNDKEYDWLCTSGYEWFSVYLFDVYYEHHKIKNIDIRRRKLIKDFKVPDYRMQITPKIIRYLIEYGKFLSKQEERKYKLKKLNEKGARANIY